MTLVIVLLLVVLLSIIINRIATVALTFTGMSREMAAFQARSAFTTVGFTTTEAESVVKHPVRRRIISLLMLMGNAGLVTVMATLITSLVEITGSESSSMGYVLQGCVLVAGLGGLWMLASSKWIDDRLFQIIGWALRRYTRLESFDFLELLQLSAGYSVTELNVEPEDWLAGRTLADLHLNEIGINVLGIQRRDGDWVGTPVGSTYLRRGDRLIVYGAHNDLIRLDKYRADEAGEEAYWQLVEANREERRRLQEEMDQRRAERAADATRPEPGA